MNSNYSEAQVTQTGQAIKINSNTASVLSSLFAPSIGPFGTYKAIISQGLSLRITKDGTTLCKEINFVHPTALVITRAAISLSNTLGDGSSSFIVLCCDIFNTAFRYFCDGSSIAVICMSLENCMCDIREYVNSLAIPLDDAKLQQLALSSLNTKLDKFNSRLLADILCKAIKVASQNKFFDINMIEVMKMQEGDTNDTMFVDGLVLDHAGRHSDMPEEMDNVGVLVINISLEYEKPEINTQFCYSSAEQRSKLAQTERDFILQKARSIVQFAEKVKKETGKGLIIVSEKGIDPYSLEILGGAGILALRRAKRRNLERLIRSCGGNIVTQLSQLDISNLGYCQKVRVTKIGEEKFTFIEGVPLRGACTVLIRGNSEHEMDRMVNATRSTLKSLCLALREKKCTYGGYKLYKGLVGHIRSKLEEVDEKDVVGYKIMESVYVNMIKTLLRNAGKNVEEDLVKTFRAELEESIVDNFSVVSSVISNSVVVAITLFMVDEIIKAGKPIKEDKMDKPQH